MSPPTTQKDEEAKADISGHVNVFDASSDEISFTALVAEGEFLNGFFYILYHRIY